MDFEEWLEENREALDTLSEVEKAFWYEMFIGGWEKSTQAAFIKCNIALKKFGETLKGIVCNEDRNRYRHY